MLIEKYLSLESCFEPDNSIPFIFTNLPSSLIVKMCEITLLAQISSNWSDRLIALSQLNHKQDENAMNYTKKKFLCRQEHFLLLMFKTCG